MINFVNWRLHPKNDCVDLNHHLLWSNQMFLFISSLMYIFSNSFNSNSIVFFNWITLGHFQWTRKMIQNILNFNWVYKMEKKIRTLFIPNRVHRMKCIGISRTKIYLYCQFHSLSFSFHCAHVCCNENSVMKKWRRLFSCMHVNMISKRQKNVWICITRFDQCVQKFLTIAICSAQTLKRN